MMTPHDGYTQAHKPTDFVPGLPILVLGFNQLKQNWTNGNYGARPCVCVCVCGAFYSRCIRVEWHGRYGVSFYMARQSCVGLG